MADKQTGNPLLSNTIGVFFGSRSPEHDVSILTGTLVARTLVHHGYDVVPVYISKQGDWYISEKLLSLDFFNSLSTNPDEFTRALKRIPRYTLDTQSTGQMYLRRVGLPRRYTTIDIAFPTFHGAFGEDGTFQGLCELLGVPYVGCGVASSAVAMDKALTKLLFQQFDIPTTRFMYIMADEWRKHKEEVRQAATKLGFPLFIKPAHLGSSIGMAHILGLKDFDDAIDVALHYDDKVVIEKAVKNVQDLTCCVIGDGAPEASLVQESKYTQNFFSYEDKYLADGGAQLGHAEDAIVIPADIPKSTTRKIREMSLEIFKLFGCSGVARIDFLYDAKSKKLYANEINTMPGTLYHHLWKASGVPFINVLNRLLLVAERNHTKQSKLVHTFESTILQHAQGAKLARKISPEG